MHFLSKPTEPSILFCGKHRVNFALCEPVYQLLRRERGIRLYLSSGRYRHRVWGWRPPRDPEMLNERIFGEFGVDPRHFLKTTIRDTRPYDVVYTSNADEKLIPQHTRKTAQIFQGVSFRNFAVHEKYLRFDKLFFIGRYHLDQYFRRGILKEGDPRIELVGMPKLDCLVDGTIKRDDVLRGFGLDPALPTVLWAPTGARHNGFELLGHAGMAAIAATGANMIIKLHDHPRLPQGQTPADVANHAKAGLRERQVLAEHSNIAPLLVAADLLVTDASSVAFEFCIMDRPIVFIDVPQLIENRGAMADQAMDLETHGRKIGRIVGSAEELRETIRAELTAPAGLSAPRRAAAEHIFHQPGGASRRAADLLLKMARG